MDLAPVLNEKDDLRFVGVRRGAGIFARGEGIAYLNGGIYFGCTTGGPNMKGQIWRHTPSPHEGTPRENAELATLELMLEPNDQELMDCPDQFSGTPWGDLLVWEDGDGEQSVLGISPGGDVYRFARNAIYQCELAGVCFSPVGSSLFVNNMAAGLTFAITGPWKSFS